MKLKCVVYAPIETYSGYGARSRDLVKALIETKGEEYNIQILSCPWGNTSQNFIEDNLKEWGFLKERIINQLQYQPDIWIMITVPNEYQKLGKYNIGITAGIETNMCDVSWIEGCNKMDLILTSSKHAKDVISNTIVEIRDQNNNKTNELKLNKPIDILFEGVNLDKYFKNDKIENNDLTSTISNIKEKYCFLFVGSWLQGILGEDRKNVGLLVKSFYETFKNKKEKPALILKTQGANCSYLDREQILKKLDQIKDSINSKDLPNIYLLHGDLTDEDMNYLYNHPKIKTMISLTKGEGFGRPLLEFSLVQKPIICSGWSGVLDFLNPEFTNLIPGQLNDIHPSAVTEKLLIPQSKWFNPSYAHIGLVLKDLFENYSKYLEKSKRQAFYSKTNFSYDKMKEKLNNLLLTYLPEFPKPIVLKLPSLDSIRMPSREKENITIKH